MKNPFKFGTIVEKEYFTDRQNELQYICRILDSENHLALISPRRFGKSSLVLKAVKQTERPYIMLNMQSITNVKMLNQPLCEMQVLCKMTVASAMEVKGVMFFFRVFRLIFHFQASIH